MSSAKTPLVICVKCASRQLDLLWRGIKVEEMTRTRDGRERGQGRQKRSNQLSQSHVKYHCCHYLDCYAI